MYAKCVLKGLDIKFYAGKLVLLWTYGTVGLDQMKFMKNREL